MHVIYYAKPNEHFIMEVLKSLQSLQLSISKGVFLFLLFSISCEGIVNDESNGKFLCFGLICGKTKGVWRIFVTKGIN